MNIHKINKYVFIHVMQSGNPARQKEVMRESVSEWFVWDTWEDAYRWVVAVGGPRYVIT